MYSSPDTKKQKACLVIAQCCFRGGPIKVFVDSEHACVRNYRLYTRHRRMQRSHSLVSLQPALTSSRPFICGKSGSASTRSSEQPRLLWFPPQFCFLVVPVKMLMGHLSPLAMMDHKSWHLPLTFTERQRCVFLLIGYLSAVCLQHHWWLSHWRRKVIPRPHIQLTPLKNWALRREFKFNPVHLRS